MKRGRFVTSRCVIYARRKNKIFHAPSQPPLTPLLTKRSGIPTFRTKERRSLNETFVEDVGESGSGENENESDEETVKERRSTNIDFEDKEDKDYDEYEENHGDRKEEEDEEEISSGSGSGDNDNDSILRERRGLNKVKLIKDKANKIWI